LLMDVSTLIITIKLAVAITQAANIFGFTPLYPIILIFAFLVIILFTDIMTG
jgi:hypothetical protein